MSHPSRPQARGPARRRRRDIRLDSVQTLEQRALLAPFLATSPLQASLIAPATQTDANMGTVTLVPATSTTPTPYPSAAPTTSVNLLTPASSFGGDIVRIEAGPGGVFGNVVYAISRGAGENTGAVNRPGVIYRVDPVTGKSTVFFDLNTVINQLEPGGTASESAGGSTGLTNWYDITFDPEGYFNGSPSMFVSSVDRTDPNKNVIYQIGPDGSFLGMFVSETANSSGVKFDLNPSAVLVPPVEDQSFLRGLIAGSGTGMASGSGSTTFTALYFNANGYSPGQNISSTTLPTGVNSTALNQGPIVGLTAANQDYFSPVYSAFTDFGTPAGGGIAARPGLSGVQGLNGESLIVTTALAASSTTLIPDQTDLVTTQARRFEDIAFDQYGYFSQGQSLASGSSTSTSGTASGTSGAALSTPVSAGNLFVSDLATGVVLNIAPVAPLPTTAVNVPIQNDGSHLSFVTDAEGNVQSVLTGGTNEGGRILRITPSGQITVFAAGFNTSGASGASAFDQSSLSITFSADGTALYASDDDGIWQFKSIASLASSTTGSLIGLNDLRTMGVPYDGSGSAVAIVDTGVDGTSPPFRGRVA
ncbi:SMP-30/gluconolactonase/LRE family protein, partial [Singulisphaera rosea]